MQNMDNGRITLGDKEYNVISVFEFKMHNYAAVMPDPELDEEEEETLPIIILRAEFHNKDDNELIILKEDELMQDVSDDDDCEYNVEIYAIEDQEELSEVADYFESLIEEEEEA